VQPVHRQMKSISTLKHPWNYIQDCHGKSSIQQEDHIQQQIYFNLRKTVKCCMRSIALYSAGSLTLWKEGQKYLWCEMWCWSRMERVSWADKWSIIKSQGGEEHLTNNKKEGKLTGLVTSCVGTAFWNTLLKPRYMEGWKRR